MQILLNTLNINGSGGNTANTVLLLYRAQPFGRTTHIYVRIYNRTTNNMTYSIAVAAPGITVPQTEDYLYTNDFMSSTNYEDMIINDIAEGQSIYVSTNAQDTHNLISFEIWGEEGTLTGQDTLAVAGCNESTDMGIMRWKGTTGLVAQDSVVTIADNGDILTPGDIQGDSITLTNTVTEISTDITLAGNSNSILPTQAAVKAYADQLLTAHDVMIFKGVIDASGNPNYPAGIVGDTYKISVAGKIGGVSGINVEVQDMIICITAGVTGNQATVGTNWAILQSNIDGAVTGPASAINNSTPVFDSTSGKIIKDSKVTITPVATGSTITLADGKTVTVNFTVTFSGTDGQTFTLPVSSDTLAALGTAQTFTQIQAINKTDIQTTSTDGVLIENTTPATSVVPVQMSPRTNWLAQVWNTTATAVSQTMSFIAEVLPTSGATPTGVLRFGYSLAGAAYSYYMYLTSRGFLGLGTSSPATIIHAASTITTSPRGIMSSQHNDDTSSARFHGRKSRGTPTVPTVVVTGDKLSGWVASGYDGVAYQEMSGIFQVVTGTVGNNRVPTALEIWTATDATPSVLTKRIAIDNTGAETLVSGTRIDNGLNTYKYAGSVTSGNSIYLPGSPMATLTTIGSYGTGSGKFNSPQGVAIDSNGLMYVADTLNNRISRFNPADITNTFTSWGTSGSGSGNFSSPSGVAVDSAGLVYVVDTGNRRVVRFNPTDFAGTFTSWGTSGSGSGQFSLPRAISLDSTPLVYVADTSNNRVVRFNPTDFAGTFTTYGTNGSGSGNFHSPYGIYVVSSTLVYVADMLNNRIVSFNPANFAGTFTTYGTVGSGSGNFNNPQGVTVDSNGLVYVSDTLNNRVVTFGIADFAGTFFSYSSMGLGTLWALVVTSAGVIYTTNSNQNCLKYFNRLGYYGIGEIWNTDNSVHTRCRIDNSGNWDLIGNETWGAVSLTDVGSSLCLLPGGIIKNNLSTQVIKYSIIT